MTTSNQSTTTNTNTDNTIGNATVAITTRTKLTATLLIGLTVTYTFLLLLSPPGWLPGEPAWAIRPETLQELLNESINFFFILPLLNGLGYNGMVAPMVHPVSQAFFNFAIAWIFMFLPLMLLDPRGRKLPRVLLWGLAMFLTNVFLMPYMVARLFQPSSQTDELVIKGRLAQVFGAIGLWVGGLSVAWFGWNRPDLGGLAERFAYLAHQAITDRATLAFCVDLVLFWIFQVWLMGAVMKVAEQRWLRFIPFLGLGVWLVL